MRIWGERRKLKKRKGNKIGKEEKGMGKNGKGGTIRKKEACKDGRKGGRAEGGE